MGGDLIFFIDSWTIVESAILFGWMFRLLSGCSSPHYHSAFRSGLSFSVLECGISRSRVYVYLILILLDFPPEKL